MTDFNDTPLDDMITGDEQAIRDARRKRVAQDIKATSDSAKDSAKRITELEKKVDALIALLKEKKVI